MCRNFLTSPRDFYFMLLCVLYSLNVYFGVSKYCFVRTHVDIVQRYIYKKGGYNGAVFVIYRMC